MCSVHLTKPRSFHLKIRVGFPMRLLGRNTVFPMCLPWVPQRFVLQARTGVGEAKSEPPSFHPQGDMGIFCVLFFFLLRCIKTFSTLIKGHFKLENKFADRMIKRWGGDLRSVDCWELTPGQRHLAVGESLSTSTTMGAIIFARAHQ